jgi:hypothetical protein
MEAPVRYGVLMWRRGIKTPLDAAEQKPQNLKYAIRQARIESAERTGVVVDLRDAELARLELLNEALDPIFSDVPKAVELFDRGISQGDSPRLWIDAIAHVAMDRDKRLYRFVQDTRFSRQVLAETTQIPEMVAAITSYVARRLIERERALAEDARPVLRAVPTEIKNISGHKRRRVWPAFLFGILVGALALAGVLWLIAARLQP